MNLLSETPNDGCRHSPNKKTFIPREIHSVAVAAAVDVERVVAGEGKSFMQRHFKYCGNFVLTGDWRDIGWQQTDDGRDVKTSDAVYRRKLPKDMVSALGSVNGK